MAFRQVIHARQVMLVDPLGRVVGNLLDQIAFHLVDPRLRRDPVAAAEQARQAWMADRDVQMVRIIV